jgi:hypothetical protein
MAYNWNIYPGGQIYNPQPNPADQINTYPRYLEPVQGSCDNCHLVAALSSLAWVNPQKIVASLARTADPSVDQVAFNNQNVQMYEKVWIDGITYKYTRSSEYPTGELWPALYEKGYVKLLNAQYNKDPEPPDPGTVNWGAKSVVPLQRISVGYGALGQYLTNEAFPKGGPYADWFDVIQTYCDAYVNNSAQAKYPGIAWSGVHTFSILGLSNKGGKWIIVRDPMVNDNKKPAGTFGDANWTVSHKNYNVGAAIPGTTATIVVPLANGIFGVSAANFAGFVTNFAFVGAPKRW